MPITYILDDCPHLDLCARDADHVARAALGHHVRQPAQLAVPRQRARARRPPAARAAAPEAAAARQLHAAELATCVCVCVCARVCV